MFYDMWVLFNESNFVWVHVQCMVSEATGSALCFGNVLVAQRAVARETGLLP